MWAKFAKFHSSEYKKINLKYTKVLKVTIRKGKMSANVVLLYKLFKKHNRSILLQVTNFILFLFLTMYDFFN